MKTFPGNVDLWCVIRRGPQGAFRGFYVVHIGRGQQTRNYSNAVFDSPAAAETEAIRREALEALERCL